MFRDAIRQLIADDATVTAALATYKFDGATSTPAIFTREPVPNVAGPYIVIESMGGSLFGTKGSEGGQFLLDVRIVGDQTPSDAALTSIAEAVWLLVNRADLSSYLTDWTDHVCVADPPELLRDVEGFPGYIVRVRASALVA